jgi:hypothetical protein
MTLREMLSTVEDSRSKFGLRHSMENMLLMILMGVMSGYNGFRPIARFLKRHQTEIRESLSLNHRVPSHVTVRNILQSLNVDNFATSFNQWANQYVPACKGDTKAADGKALKSTVTNCSDPLQNFYSMVSIFASQRGIVLSCSKIENKKESEQPSIRQLIEALDVKGEIFTMDALHCQKKL